MHGSTNAYYTTTPVSENPHPSVRNYTPFTTGYPPYLHHGNGSYNNNPPSPIRPNFRGDPMASPAWKASYYYPAHRGGPPSDPMNMSNYIPQQRHYDIPNGGYYQNTLPNHHHHHPTAPTPHNNNNNGFTKGIVPPAVPSAPLPLPPMGLDQVKKKPPVLALPQPPAPLPQPNTKQQQTSSTTTSKQLADNSSSSSKQRNKSIDGSSSSTGVNASSDKKSTSAPPTAKEDDDDDKTKCFPECSQSSQNRCFTCPKCSKIFKRGDHLKRHLLSVHDKEHPYQCGDCQKGFPSVNKILSHANASHACKDASHYLCCRCTTRFNEIAQLEKHAQQLHAQHDLKYMNDINNVSKTFSCSKCSRTSMLRENSKKNTTPIAAVSSTPFKQPASASSSSNDPVETPPQMSKGEDQQHNPAAFNGGDYHNVKKTKPEEQQQQQEKNNNNNKSSSSSSSATKKKLTASMAAAINQRRGGGDVVSSNPAAAAAATVAPPQTTLSRPSFPNVPTNNWYPSHHSNLPSRSAAFIESKVDRNSRVNMCEQEMRRNGGGGSGYPYQSLYHNHNPHHHPPPPPPPPQPPSNSSHLRYKVRADIMKRQHQLAVAAPPPPAVSPLSSDQVTNGYMSDQPQPPPPLQATSKPPVMTPHYPPYRSTSSSAHPPPPPPSGPAPTPKLSSNPTQPQVAPPPQYPRIMPPTQRSRYPPVSSADLQNVSELVGSSLRIAWDVLDDHMTPHHPGDALVYHPDHHHHHPHAHYMAHRAPPTQSMISSTSNHPQSPYPFPHHQHHQQQHQFNNGPIAMSSSPLPPKAKYFPNGGGACSAGSSIVGPPPPLQLPASSVEMPQTPSPTMADQSAVAPTQQQQQQQQASAQRVTDVATGGTDSTASFNGSSTAATTSSIRKSKKRKISSASTVTDPRSPPGSLGNGDSKSPCSAHSSSSSPVDINCLVCQATFEGIDQLMGHIENAHLNSNPNMCCICNKKFAQAGNVKRHIRFVHLRYRPHRCDHCGQCFDRICYLHRHLRQHKESTNSQFDPCTCPVCGQDCMSSLQLRGHFSRKHLAKGQENAEQYSEMYKKLFTEDGRYKQMGGLGVRNGLGGKSKSKRNMLANCKARSRARKRIVSRKSIPATKLSDGNKRHRPNPSTNDDSNDKASPGGKTKKSSSSRGAIANSAASTSSAPSSKATRMRNNVKNKAVVVYGPKLKLRHHVTGLLKFTCRQCVNRRHLTLAALVSHLRHHHHHRSAAASGGDRNTTTSMLRRLCLLCGYHHTSMSQLRSHVRKRHMFCKLQRSASASK